MTGELLAMRRASVGAPVADYARLVDRARVNRGGRGGLNASSTAITATSLITKTVTAHVDPHTKGDYTELIAATGHDAETLEVYLMTGPAATTVNSSTLLDIAFGAALAEVVKIPNMNVSHNGAIIHVYRFPFRVPAGTRIAARCQSAVTVQGLGVACRVMQGGDHSAAPTVCTTLNADTATSNGTAPTAAGSTNTKAAWNELVSAAATSYRRLVVSVGATATNGTTAATGLIDIGIGGAGSESVIVGDIFYDMVSTERIFSVGNGCYTVDIRPGDRLAWRYQATNTGNGARPVATVHLLS